MNKQERWSIVRAFAKQYQEANKKEKVSLLDRIANSTRYDRDYLKILLRRPPRKKRRIQRKRISQYQQVKKPLKKIWAISNYACGKRLAPIICIYQSALKRHEEVVATKQEERLLFKISPATIDRLLKRDRQKITLKARARTKPGTLLKNQIPIHTFADWDNAKVGFLEIDTVHHCGDSPAGEYFILWTLQT